MKKFGQYFVAALIASSLAGCATGPIQFVQDGECGPEPGSNEWWAEKAMLPPGTRQSCHKGKMWPPRPRPTVERQQFTHTYHSEHYWPLPYVCQDRQYVKDIVSVQQQNGWEQQSTLYARHFDDEQQLNTPGRLQLMDVLEINPLQYRTVYIQSTYNIELDNARLANVQQIVSEVTGGSGEVPVVIRRGRDYSRPAVEVKQLNDLFRGSLPTPRLGSLTGGGGGGGGATGGVSGGGAAPGGP